MTDGMTDGDKTSLWRMLRDIAGSLRAHRLADVFRSISFAPKERYGPHSHQRIEINYVRKGRCILYLDHESVNFKEGEMMIITSGVNHMFEAGSKGTTLLQLEFLPDIFSDARLHTDGSSPAALFTGNNRVFKIVNNTRIMQAVQRIVSELNSRKPHYEYLVVMYYAELLLLVYRYIDETSIASEGNATLGRAIRLMRAGYSQPLSISGLAAELGCSDRYLRHLFQRYLNITPVEYLNQVRINKAIELFRNTQLSVKEVAYECGFRSPQYFSRKFKEQTGSSPRKAVK